MILLVDIGNSRIKWACAGDGEIGSPRAFPRPRLAHARAFEQAWCGLTPSAVAVCCVAGVETVDALAQWTYFAWGIRPLRLRTRAREGHIVCGYPDPSCLGADRWANLIGARALVGETDTQVVDAGTAVTVDALRGDGQHLGGAILTGLDASRRALLTAAPGLPEAFSEDGLPSRHTSGAIGMGTLVGLAGAIERVAGEVGGGLHRPRRLLTGGDAERLAPYLSPDWEWEPCLTLQGLYSVSDERCAG